MSEGVVVTKRIHFSMANKGKREIKPGPPSARDTPNGRVPRVARLMALAIRFDRLLDTGAVRDQAELGRTRPRYPRSCHTDYESITPRPGHPRGHPLPATGDAGPRSHH
jgi:hypothetical protein